MNQKVKNEPAFPTRLENTSEEAVTGFSGENVQAKSVSFYSGISARDYFAVHAPAMPGDFPRIGQPVERLIPTNTGGMKKATVQEWEPLARQHARWALEFADAVIALRGAP